MAEIIDYTVHLLRYPAALIHDQFSRMMIMGDEYIFATYFAAITQSFHRDDETPNATITSIVLKQIPGFEHEVINELSLDMEKQEQMTRIIKNLRRQFSEHITTTYVNDFFFGATVYRHLSEMPRAEASDAMVGVIDAIIERINRSFEQKYGPVITSLHQINGWLVDLMDLTVAESQLIDVAILFSSDVRFIIFRDLLLSIIKTPSISEHFYAAMVGDGIPHNQSGDVTAALDAEKSKPIAIGIVPYDSRLKRLVSMSDFWVNALTVYAASEAEFHSRFVKSLADVNHKGFGETIAKLEPADEQTMYQFIESVIHGGDRHAANVLLYGSRHLNKHSLINGLIDSADATGYVAVTKGVKARDVPGVCYLAQRAVARRGERDSILVIDRAEEALTKQHHRPAWMLGMFDDELDSAEHTLNSDEMLLLANTVPTIWLTNAPSNITDDNVGRFMFHAELRSGSRKDRRVEIDKVIGELGFTNALAQHLSKYHELGVQQIHSAARMTTLLKKDENAFKRYIANSQKALKRDKMEELRDSVTKYSLDLLNLSGNMPIDKIIKALQKKEAGTMCLYGPPGTGKTQLAEYIAMQLDKPLIIKPASELLSMWLGESEKNIAKMFDEAGAEGAVLLLDEADSFLRDRALATKSWEVTQVNELLQRMERFPGVFICATNLFSALDAAALRRFTFKLEFRPLDLNQRMQMLQNEVGQDLSKLPPKEHENLMMELMLIKFLTPGDFATVRRQANLLDEQLTVNDWLQRLTIESKAKLVGVQRNTYLTDEDLRAGEVTTKLKGE